MKKEHIKDLNSIKDSMTINELKQLLTDQYTPTVNSFMQRTFKYNFKKIAFFTILSILLSYYLQYRINAFFPNIMKLFYNHEYYFGTLAILLKASIITTLWYVCILLGYNHYKLENIISSEDDKKQYLQIVYQCAYNLNIFRVLSSIFVIAKYSGLVFLYNQNHYKSLFFISICIFCISLLQFFVLIKNPKQTISFYYHKYGNYITIINILIIIMLL